MTVSTTENKDSYTAAALQTIFPYTFRIFADSDLKVFVDGVLKTLTTDYTVTNAGNPSGGNVVFNDGLVGGESVVNLRELPITQAIDYVENDNFPAESHEEGLDRSVMILQELKNLIGQSLKLGESSVQSVPTLPDLVANKVLGTNALNALEWQSIIDVTLLAVAAVDETDTDTTKNKLVSNNLLKLLEDYRGLLTTKGDILIRGASVSKRLAVGTNGQFIKANSLVTDGIEWGSVTVSKNRIINGDFRIWQRGTGPFSITVDNTYSSDRWVHKVVGAGVLSVTQDTDTPADLTGHSMKLDVTTADSSLAATDLSAFEQRIEGLNLQDLAFGTAAAKNVTVSFRVKAAKTGVHCVALANSGINRSQVKEFTIVTANTWETHSVTFDGDTSGTWLVDSGIGLRVRFALAAGSNFHGTADVWAGADNYATAACVNEMDNTANNFFIRDVNVEIGAVAGDFESRSFQAELDLCKYYFERFSGANLPLGAGFAAQTTNSRNPLLYAEKRAIPTITPSAGNIIDITHNLTTAVSSSLTFNPITEKSTQMQSTTSGLTVGEGNFASLINSGSVFIDINAEL